jgi:hypothetical protein
MSTVFEECFHLDAAEAIICFETKGQFTLVQMLAVSETSLVLAKLVSAPTQCSENIAFSAKLAAHKASI